jgi:hypothetical protein
MTHRLACEALHSLANFLLRRRRTTPGRQRRIGHRAAVFLTPRATQLSPLREPPEPIASISRRTDGIGLKRATLGEFRWGL